MPIYEYQCSNCGHILEELQSMSEPALTKCPNCGKETLKRLIGKGGGLIFKGSGFYLTDYKKSSSDTSKKTDTKIDTKTETKTEVKRPAKTETKKSSSSDKK